MSNIKTIEGKVRAILYDVPATRNDDMKLYFLVCKECVKEKHGIEDISLEYAMNHYIELGLPNYETVRRSRAKIQATAERRATFGLYLAVFRLLVLRLAWQLL